MLIIIVIWGCSLVSDVLGSNAGWLWREVGFGNSQRELLVGSCGCGVSWNGDSR